MSFRSVFLTVFFALPITVSGEQPVIEVVTSEYPPYVFLKDGQVAGEDTATVRRVLSEMGYQPNIRILPWARAENLVRAGQADMLYPLILSEDRARHYHYTDAISSARDVFFKRESQALEWQTLDDLTGLNFGLSAAYSYPQTFMDWLFEGNGKMTRITHEQPELTGLRMVALSRVDLFICEQSVCEHLLEQKLPDYPELAGVERMPGNVGPRRDFHAAFSRNLPNGRELRDEFNTALERIGATESN